MLGNLKEVSRHLGYDYNAVYRYYRQGWLSVKKEKGRLLADVEKTRVVLEALKSQKSN